MNSVINNILGNNVSTSTRQTNANNNVLGNNVCTKVNQNNNSNPNNNILNDNVSTLSNRESDIALGAVVCKRNNCLNNLLCRDDLCPTNDPDCPSHRICIKDCVLDCDCDSLPTCSCNTAPCSCDDHCLCDGGYCVCNSNPNCPSHRICITDCPLDKDIIRYPSDKENKIATIADFIGWTEIEITGTKTKILKKKDIPTSHPLKRTYTDNQTIKYGDIGKIIG